MMLGKLWDSIRLKRIINATIEKKLQIDFWENYRKRLETLGFLMF